jgi:hypothetical protein
MIPLFPCNLEAAFAFALHAIPAPAASLWGEVVMIVLRAPFQDPAETAIGLGSALGSMALLALVDWDKLRRWWSKQ